MPVVGGPVLAILSLLVVAGAAKVARPSGTAGALRSANLPSSLSLVRALGLVELAVGVTAISSGAWPALAAAAVLYLGFAGFVALALRRNLPISSCGCFGSEDTPPSWTHVVVNACSVTALAIGIAVEPGPWLGLGRSGLDVVAPVVAFALVTVYLLYAVVAVLPRSAVRSRPVGSGTGAAT